MKISQKDTLLIISILEAIYVVYFLRFFKTTFNFDKNVVINLLKKIGINSKNLVHPTYKSKCPISWICPFGHFMSWFIAAWLIIRFLIPVKRKIILYINLAIVALIFIFSFMNLNAVLYLLPFVLFDIGLTIYLLKKNRI